MKFMNKFQKFMYGRYGVDQLYYFLFGLYLILFIVNLFFQSSIITYIELFLVIWMLYRCFSKKIAKRSTENVVYLKRKKKVLQPFIIIKRNFKDKNHVYKKCRQCHITLKLPLPDKKGVKTVKCPHCHKRMKVFTLKNQKVEVIK